jgi:hypothetical protein
MNLSPQHHQVYLPFLHRHLLHADAHLIAQTVLVVCGGTRHRHRVLVKAVEIVREVVKADRPLALVLFRNRNVWRYLSK